MELVSPNPRMELVAVPSPRGVERRMLFLSPEPEPNEMKDNE